MQPLADFRASQGRSSCIWTLSDLDQTYGGHAPQHIRQALSDAHVNWTTKPRWVLLVSDHEANFNDSYEIDDWLLHNPELGRWEDHIRGLWPYMDLNDDNVPEISVGRLPAFLPNFIPNYIAKVIAHDNEVRSGSGYTGTYTLLQDMDDSGNDGEWVRELGDSLFTSFDVNPGKQILRISEMPCCYANWEQAALGAWNSGPGHVLALGAGSNWFQLVGFFELCGLAGYWTIDKLAANGRFPALLALSCSVNATDNVIASSCDTRGTLAEAMLLSRADRGASVVIGPMRNTIQWWNFHLGKHLLIRKAVGDQTWGEVFANAMRDALSESPEAYDHVFQFVLEGDPAAQANREGVTAVGPTEPVELSLSPPRPNPARGRVQMSYYLPEAGQVSLKVLDLAGRTVRTLVSRREEPGAYAVSWDLDDEHGKRVRAGVYYAMVRAGSQKESRRLVIVP